MAACFLALMPGLAMAQDSAPMSAIDWLSDSLATPPQIGPEEPPVEGGARVAEVTVTPLGAEQEPRPDAIGLLAPHMTGLPADLWGASEADVIARLIREEQTAMLPAAQALLLKILLAETDPPDSDDTDGDTVFLARIDKLLQMGALDQAHALLTRAGTATADVTRRWFDTALLIGAENEVCTAMDEVPDLTPTYPARIFCLARSGDWDGAVLLMGTARALGLITEEEDARLSRFLDPDLFEGEDALPVPRRVTPLTFRLFEAFGDSIPTTTLPLAFAQADLRSNIGWKAQVEAAERLARTGAVSDNQLLGLYTQQKAAASGGIWERVRAVQALEAALDDPDALATLLPDLWETLSEAETEVPIARIHGPTLAAHDLPGQAGEIALRMGLLSEDYETVAQQAEPETDIDRFLVAVAKGDVSGVTPPGDDARAVADGFSGMAPPEELSALVEDGKLGEALLRALNRLDDGAQGDLDDLAGALALLRAVGLEGTARRVALEYLILERRG
nr:hypothetical protein [Maritimibacter dapengensis]